MALITLGPVPIHRSEKSVHLPCSSGRNDCFYSALHLREHTGRNGKWSRKHFRFVKAASTDGHLASERVVVDDFGFKPSFEEYLKALESVKSGRDKKQTGLLDAKESTSQRKWKTTASVRTSHQEKKTKFDRGTGTEKQQKRGNNASDDNKRGGNRKFELDRPENAEVDSKRKIKKKNSEKNVTDQRRLSIPSDVASVDERSSKRADGKDSRWIRTIDGVGGKGTEFCSNSYVLERDGNEARSASDRLTRERGQIKRSMSPLTGNLKDSEMLWKRKRDATTHVTVEDDERAAFRSFEDLNGIIGKPQVSKRMMEERIQNLANCLNGADIGVPAWMLSKMMRSARIKFSDYTILRLIQILGKYGNWQRVLQVIDWLETGERYKSNRLRYVYTTALDILGKAKRPVEAFNLFSAMLEQMSSYPDIVAYHSIAVTLGQAGHMKELFDVIDIMRSPPKKKFKTGALGKWDPRVEPDIVVYNSVLNACVKREQWEGAFWVLQQLKEKNEQPTAATYGLIMEVMFVCGKYNLVHDFFSKLKKSFIPNALAYKVVLNTLWKEGKIEEATLAVDEMEKRGIVGSASVYYDLARCLCSAGRAQEAVTQVDKICRVASKPLVVTYTGLLQACAESGHIQDAVFIFDYMRKFCSPNLVTCNIMMKAFLQHGLFEEAKKLFFRMADDDSESSFRLKPDVYTFNTLLEACVKEGKWDDVEKFYESMLKNGYKFNAKRHLRMVLDASRAGKDSSLELTWESLIKGKRVPPPALLKQRFCSSVKRGDMSSALAFVEVDLTEELNSFSKKSWLNLLKENAQILSAEALVLLLQEGNSLSSRISPNIVLQNLMISCQEFLRNYQGGEDLLNANMQLKVEASCN